LLSHHVAIECVLQNKKIFVDSLRFHLTKEDCLLLLQSVRITHQSSKDILLEFSQIPSKQRTHVLLGHDILSRYNSVQTKDCVAVITEADAVPSFKFLDLVLQREADESVAPWREDFMAVQGDDHDGDDCYVMIDDPRDDYAF
jgi:hypothetical protein